MKHISGISPPKTEDLRTIDQMSIWLPALLMIGMGSLAWIAFIVLVPLETYFAAFAMTLALALPLFGTFLVLRAAARQQWALLTMVFAVIFLSDFTLRARAAGDTGADAQSLLKLGIWFSGMLLIPWTITELRKAARTTTLAPLLLFGGWAILGATYSITPAYTFAAGCAFTGIFVLAVVSAERLPTATGLTCVLVALAAALTVSLIMYFAVPERAMTPMEGGTILRLAGFFGSPNNLGRASAMALLLATVHWFYATRRSSLVLTSLIVPLALACLYLSGSRASLTGLFAGLAVVLMTRRPRLAFALTTLLMCCLLLLLFSPWDFRDILLLMSRTGKTSEIWTLTGRTDIWAWVMSAILEKPLIGYGFASTRELIPAGYVAAYGWTTSSAHNMWLQAWVTTGTVGLVLIVASQLGTVRDTFLRPDPLRDSVFAFTALVGMLEAGPIGPSVNLLTFVWIWALASGLRVIARDSA